MSEKLLLEISKKLNALISLSLLQLFNIKDFNDKEMRKKRSSEIVCYFADLGIDPKDIALILDMSIGSVRTLLTPSRRR